MRTLASTRDVMKIFPVPAVPYESSQQFLTYSERSKLLAVESKETCLVRWKQTNPALATNPHSRYIPFTHTTHPN